MNGVDLFAGAGGFSLGFEQATGVSPLVAVNHCAHAIQLHELNHPDTLHFEQDVWKVRPLDAVRAAGAAHVDWLHGSPDCTHFSRAKGGKPRSQKIRGLAWAVYEWARRTLPSRISLENVPEFLTWGPVDSETGQPIKARAGEFFRRFVTKLQALDYVVDWRVLCAADFGAPTIRKRLFLIARRDGQAVKWPEPTHGPGRAQPWRTAAECIDWTIPVRSIFDRERPLADATCRRIAAGVVKYVLNGRPFLVHLTHGGRLHSIDEPMRTITGAHRGEQALVAAFIAKHYTGVVGSDLRAPLATVTSQDHNALVTAGVEPMQIVDPKRGHHVAAFLASYYSQGGNTSRVDAPMPTVVTKDRHGLVTVTIDGQTFAIVDIGMRMLTPRELARAQGFPDSYRLEGSKTDQTARVGNSVCPDVAAALVRANL